MVLESVGPALAHTHWTKGWGKRMIANRDRFLLVSANVRFQDGFYDSRNFDLSLFRVELDSCILRTPHVGDHSRDDCHSSAGLAAQDLLQCFSLFSIRFLINIDCGAPVSLPEIAWGS